MKILKMRLKSSVGSISEETTTTWTYWRSRRDLRTTSACFMTKTAWLSQRSTSSSVKMMNSPIDWSEKDLTLQLIIENIEWETSAFKLTNITKDPKIFSQSLSHIVLTARISKFLQQIYTSTIWYTMSLSDSECSLMRIPNFNISPSLKRDRTTHCVTNQSVIRLSAFVRMTRY